MVLSCNESLNSLTFYAVLGKVKDFLGVLSEANERLQLDAKVGLVLILCLIFVYSTSHIYIYIYPY